MRLFIAEKPSVAKAIAAELGVTRRGEGDIDCGATRVIGCFGHLLGQADLDAYLPADVPTSDSTSQKLWRAQYVSIIPVQWQLRPRAESWQQLTIIARLIEEASEIVDAGDPDREAQRLIDEILAHFQGPGRPHRAKESPKEGHPALVGMHSFSDLQAGLW